MEQRFKSTPHQSIENTIHYSDADLQVAFEQFTQEETENTKTNLVNFSTIAGFLFTLVGSLYLLGLPFNNLFSGLENWVQSLPVIGGFLVTFIGLGWFSRNKKNKKNKKEAPKAPFFDSPKSRFQSTQSNFEQNNNTSFGKSSSSKSESQNRQSTEFERAFYDTYALKKVKKMYKSRKDKKIDGVCGGLAKYLGVSSTIVRLIFIIATFMGYGSPILLYFGLSIALPKEPQVLTDLQD